MAISKKEARRVAAILNTVVVKRNAIETILESGVVKNRPFRKSLKRIVNALEQPKKAAVKKAA